MEVEYRNYEVNSNSQLHLDDKPNLLVGYQIEHCFRSLS